MNFKKKFVFVICFVFINALFLASCDQISRNDFSNPFASSNSGSSDNEPEEKVVYASPAVKETDSSDEQNSGDPTSVPEIKVGIDSEVIPELTDAPKASDIPEATPVPEITGEPEVTDVPEITDGPEATAAPEITEGPEATAAPEITDAPEATAAPEITDAPEATATPEITDAPEATAAPEITDAPEATPTPEITDSPEKAAENIDAAKNDGSSIEKKVVEDEKEKEKDTSNRYLSQELHDYISKPVTEMTDEEFAAIAPTVNMTFEELVGDNGIYNGYPKALPYPDTYKIVVDLRYCVVMVFTRDEEGNYTVPHRFMICSPGASDSCTPTGVFSMKNYRVRNSIFNNTTSYAQYWTLINGRIYFHSMLYTSTNASDYTESSYNNLGKGVSHGCVRLTVPDARWIWYNIAPGTTVVIRYGAKDDEQMKEIKNRLKIAKLPSKRVKLKKGEIPDTDNWSIDEVPQEVPYENGHQ